MIENHRYIYVADLDQASGKRVSHPKRINTRYIGSSTGPDGGQLIFMEDRGRLTRSAKK